MVEAIFRTMKSVLETRPICHQRDETIRGHVFCSFLALVLRKELQERLAARGLELEWADVLGDLNALGVTTLRAGAAVCELRSLPRGVAGQVLQAAGVALGPPLRFLDEQEAAAWEGGSVVPQAVFISVTVCLAETSGIQLSKMSLTLSPAPAPVTLNVVLSQVWLPDGAGAPMPVSLHSITSRFGSMCCARSAACSGARCRQSTTSPTQTRIARARRKVFMESSMSPVKRKLFADFGVTGHHYDYVFGCVQA